MSTGSDTVHAFSNGSEFTDWLDGNCVRCAKEDTCPLRTALTEAYWDSGQVDRVLAESHGWDGARAPRRCTQFSALAEPREKADE